MDDLGPAAAGLCAWLEAALTADRATVMVHLERRHKALVATLVSQLQGGECMAHPEGESMAKLEEIYSRLEESQHDDRPKSEGQSRSEIQPKSEVGQPVVLPLEARGSGGATAAGTAAGVADLLFPDIPPDGSVEQPGLGKGKHSPSNAGRLSLQHASTLKGEESHLTVCPLNIVDLEQHPVFEMFFGFLIIVNALIMAAEVQYVGFDIAYDISYANATHTADDVWPGATVIFDTLGICFGALFTLEVTIKILSQRQYFPYSFWNWFDALIIAFFLISQVNSNLEDDFPVKPMVLRLARLVRIMRLIRVLKFIQALDALNLLVSSIIASTTILGWATLILTTVMMCCGMVMNYTLIDFMEDHTVDETVRTAVFIYFGTFSRSMITMFEVTLGNWIPVTRLLMENVTEAYMPVFVTYKVVVSFAVVKVITGVFMHETFKVAACDDDLMIINKERMRAKHYAKMTGLMDECDDSGDGTLDREEFRALVGHSRVKTWLSAMELDVRDPDAVFNLLDNDPAAPGIITAGELASGVSRLKGSARSLDLILMHEDIVKAHRKLDSLEEVITKGIMAAVAASVPAQQLSSAPTQVGIIADEGKAMSMFGRALAPVENSLNALLAKLPVAEGPPNRTAAPAVAPAAFATSSHQTRVPEDPHAGLPTKAWTADNFASDSGTLGSDSGNLASFACRSIAANRNLASDSGIFPEDGSIVGLPKQTVPLAWTGAVACEPEDSARGHLARGRSTDRDIPRERSTHSKPQRSAGPAPDQAAPPQAWNDSTRWGSTGSDSRPGANPSDVSMRLNPQRSASPALSNLGRRSPSNQPACI